MRPSPKPWEVKMTLCLAAVAMLDRSYCIVFGSDFRRSSLLGSNDDLVKFDIIKDRWMCLKAGDTSDIEFLVREIKSRFRNNDVDETNMKALLDDAVHARLGALRDQLTKRLYSMSYGEFWNTGRDKLLPDDFRAAMHDVRQVDLGAEVIVAGFSEGAPQICRVRRSGEVTVHENYCCIGEGEVLAAATLNARNQNSDRALMETIYCVHEAKNAASRVNSVSPTFSFDVMLPDGKMLVPRRVMHERLDTLYEKYHPSWDDANFIFKKTEFMGPLEVTWDKDDDKAGSEKS